jgi:serine/threonine protein kinase/tetratricopeptide (TPR) repeat protein
MSRQTPSPETIFAQAIDIAAAEERAAFLRQACGNNAQLHDEVEKLVRDHFRAGAFLQEPAAGLAARTEAYTASERPGSVIGPYKLLEQIGEGGFGLVFLAEQTEPVRRKVALKILKPGMDTRQIVARFEAERQALAIMDHPHIARVFDGGATSSGRPYFVMELVKGVPITEYCDKNHLPPRERLELFVSVCQAVQHAHQKGIIHRDLKPSNVLVSRHDTTPMVKVIDFGVAKALGQELTDKTLFTGIAQMIGTPLYMSPEQAGMSDLDIDTRSDIYSLGVLLYELLTGTTPFSKEQFKQAGYDEIRRIIREEEPPKPSTRISTLGQAASTVCTRRQSDPRRLSQLVRGELDWIVMKALDKDRNRRYETANGFALDVQRYLADEPVQAGPPSARYRLRKFLRRNRGPVLAGLLILVALVGGIIGTTAGLLRAQHEATQAGQERDRARAARDRAAATVRAMTSDIAAVALTRQQEITPEQKEFLSRALEYYRELLKETQDEEMTRAQIADAATQIGYIEYRLGHVEEAVLMLRQARELNRKLADEFPGAAKYRFILISHHHNLGILLGELGKRHEAQQEYRAAVDLARDLTAEFPDDPRYRETLAANYMALGETRTSLAIYQQLAARFPAVAAYRDGIASSRSFLGESLGYQGKRNEARTEYLAALDIYDKLAAQFPGNQQYRLMSATCHSNLGVLLTKWGKLDQAEKEFRAELTLRQKLAAEFPSMPAYRKDAASAHNCLANVLSRMRKLDEAETEYRAAIDAAKQLAAEFPAFPGHRHGLAQGHHNLGMLLREQGKTDQAETELRTAIELEKKLTAEFPAARSYQGDLANHHNELGNLLAGQRKLALAEREYRAALAFRQQLASASPTVPDYREGLASGHNNLGSALLHQKKLDQAEPEFRAALEIRKQLAFEFPAVPAYEVSLAGSFCNLGCLVTARGRPDEALALLDQAIATLSSSLQKEPRYAWAQEFLFNSHAERARALALLGRHDEAVKDRAKALGLAPANKKAFVQGQLMITRVEAGQFEAALRDADQLAHSESTEPLYNCACVYALVHAKTKEDKHAVRAIELLRQAIAKGFRDVAHLKEDADLNSLRDRDDFKKLLVELEGKKESDPKR